MLPASAPPLDRLAEVRRSISLNAQVLGAIIDRLSAEAMSEVGGVHQRMREIGGDLVADALGDLIEVAG